MARLNQDATLFARDFRIGDDENKPGPAQPVSQAEIDDLLYNDEIPAAERLERLKGLREELTTMAAADFGDEDPAGVIGEIDLAIARLGGSGADGAVETALDIDPLDHRETLSPDDDVLEALDEDDDDEADLFAEDEGDVDGVLDPKEWEDDDGFDTEKGVH